MGCSARLHAEPLGITRPIRRVAPRPHNLEAASACRAGRKLRYRSSPTSAISHARTSARRNRGAYGWLHLLALILAWIDGPASAQTDDPNQEHPSILVTVQRDGYTISGLAVHAVDVAKFKYGVALFPGHPGILRLQSEQGTPRFDMRGNFLVRSRRHWLDDETLVVLVDAPSNEWSSFSQRFRETARYGEDIAALLAQAGRRFQVDDWTFVGTSEGSISAFHAARMNPTLARRIILTASLFAANRNGPGLSGVTLSAVRVPMLWVHHEDDPCRFTPYRSAREFAQRSQSPLVTVRGGGPGGGDPCQARTSHGFIGVERQTVLAMRDWIKTGKAPSEVTP